METRISDGAWDDHQMHEMWKTHGESRLESDLQVLGFPQLCERLQEDKLHVLIGKMMLNHGSLGIVWGC
jgi:hypothetical protein